MHSRSAPAKLIAEGLQAGLLLALTDWVAGGVLRTPLALVFLTFACFALGGLVAGLIAASFRRRGLAFAIATGGALAVHGLSIVSKHIESESLIRNLVATAVVIIALNYGAFAGWVYASKVVSFGKSKLASWLSALILASGVASSSIIIWAYPQHSVTFALLSALAFPAVAWSLASTNLALKMLACLGILTALALPVALYDQEPSRRFVPSSADAIAAAEAPNVLLFVVDTFRADHLGGDESLSPHLDTLAQHGVQFAQAISSASWTLPATSSLLTSLYPSQHGAVMPTTSLPGSVETLAENFHAAGYETVAFTGGAFVSPAFGLDQGFEYFDHLAEFNFRPFRIHTPLAWRVAKNRYLALRPLLRYINEFGGMRSLNQQVQHWLDARSQRRPFFLLVHTYQVHDYYIYQPDPDDEVLDSLGPLSPTFAGRLSVHPSELLHASQADLDWFHGIYANRIRYVDQQAEILFSALREHLGGAPLITAMISDHGEGFDATRKRVHHGARLHDDLLRVPFLLIAPGQIEPQTLVTEQVRSIDLMPTLIDLAGLKVPANLSGRSLLPSLRTDSNWPTEAFGEEISTERRKLAVRTSDWKLIHTTGREESLQTYHLAVDPLEELPRSGPPPARLVEQMQGFRSRYPERDREENIIDDATQDHLRALGYID